jgi:hypothetical protein
MTLPRSLLLACLLPGLALAQQAPSAAQPAQDA